MIQKQKRGDSFQVPLQYQRESSPGVWTGRDITGCVFRSQVRTDTGRKLVSELSVVINNATLGLATLVGTPLQTQTWPEQRLVCDVEATWPDGFKQSSETILIDVEQDVTHDD